MNASLKSKAFIRRRKRTCGLCEDPKSEEQAAFWRINGYRARLVLWTPDQWERMEAPPADAQFHPTGGFVPRSEWTDRALSRRINPE